MEITKEDLIKESSFNDRLDVLKHVSDIKMKLREDITNDFVLAKLEFKDKNFIIEMTGNAYFSKKLIDIIADKAEQWVWDDEEGKYIRERLDKTEREKIKKIGKAIFDSYMIRIYMLVILNRNVEQNHLIKILSGYLEDSDNEAISGRKMQETFKSLLEDQQKPTEK